ncbi:MAG: hypothetical protein PUF51_07550 [Bifidobacteriaceae bacterium]|nr:hypothetical protein [Bifidobacteriaceae bacterium]
MDEDDCEDENPYGTALDAVCDGVAFDGAEPAVPTADAPNETGGSGPEGDVGCAETGVADTVAGADAVATAGGGGTGIEETAVPCAVTADVVVAAEVAAICCCAGGAGTGAAAKEKTMEEETERA